MTVETKLYHEAFLACLMMRFAIARSRLYSSKCALSGLAKNALRAFFLLLIARLHASLNQGFFGLFFDSDGDDFGMVCDMILTKSCEKSDIGSGEFS